MRSQLLQSMHQPNEAKDESTVADIVQNTPPVTTDEWQWEKMEHAIDGLRSQLNAHDKSFAKIQNSLGVCAHSSTSAVAKQNDNLKEHFQQQTQQTQQIKADLTEFQRNLAEQLPQPTHQPNEAKDESSDLDIVHKVKQNTPHFTTDEWRDLQDKT
eukprot:981768_1